MLTLTPFSEKLCTNKEKSDINFQCNKSSDNFIITNAQKMTVVMHRILWQKCKQNTFSSLIPPLAWPVIGITPQLQHHTVNWLYSDLRLLVIYAYFLLCESFGESQPKAYTFLMLYAKIFKSEV